METADWYDLFDKKPLVDALLDRLQHRCITIRIDGPSLRRPPPPPSPVLPTAPTPLAPPSAASTAQSTRRKSAPAR